MCNGLFKLLLIQHSTILVNISYLISTQVQDTTSNVKHSDKFMKTLEIHTYNATASSKNNTVTEVSCVDDVMKGIV